MGVGIGEGFGVRAGLGPDNGEAEGGVFDALPLGLWGGVDEEAREEGGEEDVSGDLVP